MVRTNSGRKRTLIGALFCLALAAPELQAATYLQPTAAQEQEFQAADDNGRARILIPLAKGGYHELAATLLKRYPLAGEFSANRTLYIEGLIEQGRGNLTGAVAKYRAALADDPSLTLVRADLANALALLDEDDSAKHHLQQLMAEAKTEQEAAGIRSFMDKLDAKRPFAFNGYVSVAPSTNINDGSSVDKVYVVDGDYEGEIDIDSDSEAKSGIGLSAGASAGYHKRLGNKLALVAGAGVGGQLYRDASYNSYGSSESVEIRYLIDGGYVGLGGVSSQTFRTDELGFGYISFGPRVSAQKQITPRDRVSASVIYEWRRYPDNADSNGTALLADANWTHALSSDANFGIFAGYNRVNSEALDYKSYHAVEGGLSLYKELPHGITIDLLGSYRFAHFDEEFFAYGDRRKDHRLRAEATLTKRDWNIYGFAPSLDYSYIYNFSNIANYQFDSHTVELKLTKDF
jgi:hypothetical protein